MKGYYPTKEFVDFLYHVSTIPLRQDLIYSTDELKIMKSLIKEKINSLESKLKEEKNDTA